MARADRLKPPAVRPARVSGLLLCGLLSAAGHAALLLGAAPSAAPGAVGHAEHAAHSAAMARRAPPTAVMTGRWAPLPRDTPPAVMAAAQVSAPAAVVAALSAAASRPDREATSPAGPEPLSPDRTHDEDADPDERYLPRSALDLGPAPTAPVDLPYPADAPAGRFEGLLTLFIDASGHVRRVRHDSGNLPAQLADEARQAFLASTFSPGVKDGQAVGSRLRVAVSYQVDAPQAEPTASTGPAPH